ncbi:MAG: metal ABC transporter ATP-binding protein, partial [Devosia sp.]
TPELVAKSPEYLELFGARAAATLAIYQHHHDHTHLPDGRIREADGRVVEAHAREHGEEPAEEHHHGHDHAHLDGPAHEGHRHG